MKNLFKISGALLLSITIISCSNETKETTGNEQQENTLVENRAIIEILKQKTTITGKAESFETTLDPSNEAMSINTIILLADAVDCINETKLCEELTNFIGAEKLVFNSSEEYSTIEKESPEYRLMQKGNIEINGNPYIGILYYNAKEDDGGYWFHGKLVFKLPEVKSLKGESVILELKGRK